MRVPVGSEGWYLCDWTDQADHEYTELRGGMLFAQQWASQLRGDSFAFSTLRRLLGGAIHPRSDELVTREVAWRVATRVWMVRRPAFRIPIREGEPGQAPPSAPGERPGPPRALSPSTEAQLFPEDTDSIAIADVQKSAAALGLPFCEECLKAQLPRRAAPPVPAPAPPAEEPLFPENVAAVALAQAQKNAAESGMPFCEECEKARPQGR